jgi:hypothetical protein
MPARPDDLDAIRGIVNGLVLALPVWALIWWVI